MGPLSRKPKVSVEDFCRDFYDTQVFHPIIAGEDISKVWWDTVYSSIVEADESFALIDKVLFIREMTALRLELFALAWGHKFKQERFTVPQSIFTRQYLEEKGKLELWDILLEYNQAVADSVTLTATFERMEDWQVAKVNLVRYDFFNKWCEANVADPSAPTETESEFLSCVTRVANRIGADAKRHDCILVKRLIVRLADRLSLRPNLSADALFRLGAVIFGLYRGAMEAIKAVNLQV